MSTISMEERKSLESKVKLFIHSIGAPENATSSLVNLFEPLLSGLNAKVEYSEIREILLRMDKGFEAMDKRFEYMQNYMDKHFEAMDKRFEYMQNYMDKHFEAIDKRFEDMQKHTDKRFEDMQKHTDKRFEYMQNYMDKRFEAMDKRFEDLQKYMDKRFVMILSFVSFALLAMPAIITLILKFMQ